MRLVDERPIRIEDDVVVDDFQASIERDLGKNNGDSKVGTSVIAFDVVEDSFG